MSRPSDARRPAPRHAVAALAGAWLAGSVALGVLWLVTTDGEATVMQVPASIVYAAILGSVLTVPMAVAAAGSAWWAARSPVAWTAAVSVVSALVVGSLITLVTAGPNSQPAALPTVVAIAVFQAAAAAAIIARPVARGTATRSSD